VKYKHILLDFDGTILDSRKLERTALTRTFEDFKLKVNDDIIESYHSINIKYWHLYEAGKISKQGLKGGRFRELFDAFGISGPEPEGFNRVYIDYASSQAPMYHGTVQVLEKLQRVCILSMVTNGFTQTQKRKMAAAGIEDFFENIFIAEEVGSKKPEREYFDYVHKAIDRPEISEMLIVGDSLMADIKGGSNYNIDTCWFNPEHLANNTDVRPTMVIDRLEDILSL